MLFPQPQYSAEINLATETLPSTSSEFGDIYVPEALEDHHVQELMGLLGGELEREFYPVKSHYAAFDELRLVHKGVETFAEDDVYATEYRRILEIARSQAPLRALAGATNTHKQLIAREVVIFRMGPGTYNNAHHHANEFTANILLQDNPRLAGESSGLFYTTYTSAEGPLPNELGNDECWGPREYGRLHRSEVGGMHARKAHVRHGVMPIPGERIHYPEHPGPSLCRYVLTYVLHQDQL